MNVLRYLHRAVGKFHRTLGHISGDAQAPPTYEFSLPSPHALQCARSIRGADRQPAIFIHGMLRRSGTNFIGELLRLHPDISAYPHNIYEVPFLGTTERLMDVQNAFFDGYKRNREQVGACDFLPLFGSALLAYLHAYIPGDKQLLLKVPGVEQLHHFFSVFPNEKLLILMRDGRDLVQSTIKTWPQRDFAAVCRQWDESARSIMDFADRFDAESHRFLIVRYEDAVKDPHQFMSRVGAHLGLDMQRFPYPELEKIPVKGSSALKQDSKMTWKPIQKPSDFNPVGRWAAWDNKAKATFKKICGRTIVKTGYCPDLNW